MVFRRERRKQVLADLGHAQAQVKLEVIVEVVLEVAVEVVCKDEFFTCLEGGQTWK